MRRVLPDALASFFRDLKRPLITAILEQHGDIVSGIPVEAWIYAKPKNPRRACQDGIAHLFTENYQEGLQNCLELSWNTSIMLRNPRKIGFQRVKGGWPGMFFRTGRSS
jgi:hypothetical protein